MSLNPNATFAPEDKSGQPPAIDPVAAGLPANETPSVRIDAFNCSTGPKDDGMLYERGYSYGVRMMFDSIQSRDEFMKRPTLQEDANTIRHTSESMLQETFNLEGERDGDEYYKPENPDENTMVNTLTSGTQGDIEATEPELGAILKSTFPDSGIVGVKIDDVKSMDSMCYPSNGAPYADNGPASEQTLSLGRQGRPQTLGL